MRAKRSRIAKYQSVYTTLVREIQSGRWEPGTQLPSEAALVKRFGTSRITVGRAVRELQGAGLVERRAGAGTFVKTEQAPGGLSFGLLIPDLGETEIFEPICQGMMTSPLAREHALLWGSVPGGDNSKEQRAWELCRQYIERQVSGVFFAPLELTSDKEDVNRKIARALDQAGIPMVLLDRTIAPYPQREDHDVVGVDNRRAGYVVTEHLLHLARRRIAFVAPPDAAGTAEAREAGYREALYAWNAPIEPALVGRFDASKDEPVRALMKVVRPEAIVCANDRTAGHLMQTLVRLGHRVPADVRIVGIDDTEYASLLPAPLTTFRQPTREIGDAALGAMLQRVARLDLPPREILLHGELVVRFSCGAQAKRAQITK